MSKCPPAGPGALICELLKAGMGSLTRPQFAEPPKGGNSPPQVQLLQTCILCFLFLDVFAYLFLLPSDRGYKVTPGPDHVHMLISIPPKYAVSQVVGFIKGKSAIHLARVYGEKNMTALSPNPSASWATPPHGNAVTVGYRPE
jgi:hypothetical protein